MAAQHRWGVQNCIFYMECGERKNVDIPSALVCLSNLNCTTAVMNKSKKKCMTSDRQEEKSDHIKMWRKTESM